LDKSLDRPLVAVVGGDTLLAKEVRDVLALAKPAPRMKLISATAAAPSLGPSWGPTLVPPPATDEAEEEESALIPLSPESLEGTSVAFLAGSPASSRRALKLVSAQAALDGPLRAFGKVSAQAPGWSNSGGPRLIDLTGALEEQPDARLRAPIAEPIPDPSTLLVPAAIQVIAHPAAIVLAKFLSTVARCSPVRSSQAHIFEPASERGRRGIDELQKQTVSVLTFQKLKTDVFDAQLAFNMLARYGGEALEPLEGVEQRVERHLASLLVAWPGVPMPSLRLIQVPVFHGHSFSVWVDFDAHAGAKEFSKALVNALERAGFDVRPDDPPSNAGAVGESGISVGAISADRNNPRAFWFWLVADNLRLAAENAVAVAQELL
jgi:aspartate-semialdehyde dehydrogenase